MEVTISLEDRVALRSSQNWAEAGQPLLYQHDGPCPHTTKFNARAFAAQGKAKEPDIPIVFQPGQNPDVNAVDLAFFYSLETDV